MVTEAKTVLVMAGGTGGHVFPALAVANELQQQGHKVFWLGTRSGMEAELVTKHGFEIHFINIAGLRGKGLIRWFMMPVKLVIAVIQARKVLRQLKPNIVIGMGGFASGPGGLASWISRRPLVIHEQNAIPGMTNRWLAKFATRVLEAFPGSFKKQVKAVCTGNPVRQDINELDSPSARYMQRDDNIRLLVVGGSLGAQVLNQDVPRAMSMLNSDIRPQIWHQTGRSKCAATQQLYTKLNIDARVDEFIDDMAEAYSWADLVICRAGAMTVSEITNAGVAAIFVPYPYAVDDHQTANARNLADVEAAILIQQVDLSPGRLAVELTALFNAGRKRLQKIADSAYRLRKPNATQKVSQLCLEVARG